MDLLHQPYSSWENLAVYCYKVAGTVGLMAAPLLGCTDESALPNAIDLGIAMQLTNILRDVAEDAELNRRYLRSTTSPRSAATPKRSSPVVPTAGSRS